MGFNRLVITACAMLLHVTVFAQVFSGKTGLLEDYFGEYNPQYFLAEVSGLPEKMDTGFGLEKICINIEHERVSDLKITLVSPKGTSIWLTNRNGRDSGMNYQNTCFSSKGKNGFIHQGMAPFTGEFIPDGAMEFMNDGQNPNGEWKLMIEDLRTGISGTLSSFTIQFGDHPAHYQVVKRCSEENPELCLCSDKKTNCSLLPDLVIFPSFTQNQVQEYPFNDSAFAGQLRFAATIGNIGYGPMEIHGSGNWYCGNNLVDSSYRCDGGKRPRQLIFQRIYEKKNRQITWRDVKAGTMYFEDMPGHNHYHVDNWVEFRLVKMDRGKRKLVTARGHKISYCLFSSGICFNGDGVCNTGGTSYGENMPNYGFGVYYSCDTKKQGISVGGYDTYGLLYEGQYLDLPNGLKNGEYWLEIEIDPDHRYIESNKKNNIFRMKINIQKQQP